uniref:Tumor necrosis factor-inducible gene 6 protein n=1 Tax=Bos mutus grunniens TaxID=30521 RepID=A0A8C0A5R9_BOSMU
MGLSAFERCGKHMGRECDQAKNGKSCDGSVVALQQAAGVYHREARSGKYKLTYAEAKAVCEYEGGHLATYKQLEAARKIGFHVCAAGWMAKGRVGYPIVKPGPNCGFGKTGIIDYGIRLNRSERWDAYCYNPHAKECGGVFTDPKRIFKSPGFPNEYDDNQICYWHIRLKYGQRIHLSFLDFDLEDDPACLADYVEVYDSYDDVHGFVGRYCGDELPEDIISTGNGSKLRNKTMICFLSVTESEGSNSYYYITF